MGHIKYLSPFTLTALLLYSSTTISAPPSIKQGSDEEIRDRLVSIVKNVDVEKKISTSDDFKDCKEKNPFDPKNPTNKLADATKCFEDKLKDKDPESLKKLADSLELQQYKLIKNKTVNDITEYLSKRMIKSLTGVDPDEKDSNKIREQLKFENQKLVDQSVFLELYITQLGKSALFEVSRFCFENLRLNNGQGNNFQEHWSNINATQVDPQFILANINDQGIKTDFFPGSIESFSDKDLASSEKVFNEMIKGITQSDIDPKLMKDVFFICQSSIKVLCDDFKKTNLNTPQNDSIIASGGPVKKGTNACLTQTRLQSIRSAMGNSKKILESMETQSNSEKDKTLKLVLENPIKLYERGEGKNEEDVDDITTMTSSDFLAKQDSNYFKRADECSQDPTKSDCDKDLSNQEDLDKALHDIETISNLQREAELARARKLIKEDKQKLQEYLEEKGHFELAQKLEKEGKLDQAEIEGAIQSSFDAKKIATIKSLQEKMGGRQVTDETSKDDRQGQAKQVAQDAKEERARMSQVVLFNNIITSHLELQDEEGKKLGQNVNAWIQENKRLESGGNYDTQWFQGLNNNSKNQSMSKTQGTSIIDVKIIDSILGKEKEKKSN
jgi:hypothetical protein